MYEKHNITSVSEIPELVGAFAAALGMWTDLSTPSQPIIGNPDGWVDSGDDRVSWRITATVAGSHFVRAQVHPTHPDIPQQSLVDPYADAISPRIHGIGNVLPVYLHLLGNLQPAPYVAVVIEYEGRIFRHIYLGNVEKLGVWDGGEVFGSNAVIGSSSNGTVSFNSDSLQYLFNARQSVKGAVESGGLRAKHANFPTTFRHFRGPSGAGSGNANYNGGFTNDHLVGGFGDDINDGYLARAKSPFAGRQVLVPLNLFAAMPIIGDTSFVPMGRVAGVRMVHMQDLQPDSLIEVGGEMWHVFPAMQRRLEQSLPKGAGTGAQLREYETSYWVGYAYYLGAPDSDS